MKPLFSLLFLLLLTSSTLFAQDQNSLSPAAKIIQPSQGRVALLTNQDLIELLQAKLTPEEMIAKIKAGPANFDTSEAGLRALREAGLSDTVITAMMQAEKSQSSSTAPVSAPLEEHEIEKPQSEKPEQILVPAGTQLDVEAAYTVSSLDVKPGDLISFRVLVPIKIDGRTVIEIGALLTGRVIVAKRGAHWGHGGRLCWAMQDVLAVDGTRLPIRPEAQLGSDIAGADKRGSKGNQNTNTSNSVKGTSHSREVMTRALIAGAIFPPLAPLGLIHGFKRGENAVLPEGRRFLAFIGNNATVTIDSKR
jgi:hypothetical protein